jgi:hypothetical protein
MIPLLIVTKKEQDSVHAKAQRRKGDLYRVRRQANLSRTAHDTAINLFRLTPEPRPLGVFAFFA